MCFSQVIIDRKAALVSVSLAFAHPLHGAVTLVDWLDFATTGTPGNFLMRDDSGAQAAAGSLAVTTGMGVLFSGYPRARTLASGFWVTPPAFVDSLTGTTQVSGLDVRVVPENGVASYRVDLSVPAGVEMVLMIGGLFRDSGGATQSVIVSSTSSAGGMPVELLERSRWGNGITNFNQLLDWSEATRTLSTLPSSNGDSELAFLRIGPLSGSDPRVTLEVVGSFASGAGDEITMGLGRVVPEPAGFTLMAIGGMLVSVRRRRSMDR